MLFSDIAILDENLDYQTHRYVGVDDAGFITYLGAQEPADPASFGRRYDGQGKLLIPAFYNLHAHVYMTLLRGYAENAPLQKWLNELVWPYEAKIVPDDTEWGTRLGCAEMVRYGVVSFSDMSFHIDPRAKVVGDTGMKATLCEGFIGFEPKPYSEYENFKTYERIWKEMNGSFDGRLKVEYNVHAEYTTNPQVVGDIAKLAKERGMGMHVHVSETKSEHEECKGRHDGMTPIQYFDSLGLLDVPTTAAHCVWVEDDDLKIMAERGVTAVLNPASNMKLGSGFAPVDKMLKAGVNVALGTDGMASNNNHDIMQDMYLMATIYKGRALDPTIVTPKQAFHAATRGGALAQGRTDCGLVKEGFRADLAVLDITGPSWYPLHDPLCNLVYSGHGSDVVLTMCDGQVLYDNGDFPTIDVERCKAEVSQRHNRILGQLAEDAKKAE